MSIKDRLARIAERIWLILIVILSGGILWFMIVNANESDFARKINYPDLYLRDSVGKVFYVYHIIVIDSCQYITNWQGGITHKGDCNSPKHLIKLEQNKEE